MNRRAYIAPVFGFLWLTLVLSVRPAHADGAVSGHVTIPAGAKAESLKIVLVPESARSGRLTVKVGKKGDFYFGIVPQGTWTLSVEGTELVPTSIKVLVHDNETRQDRTNYDGPPPPKQVFEVGVNLKVTYDLTLGPAKPAPGAGSEPGTAAVSDAEITGLLQSGDYAGGLAKIDAAVAQNPNNAALAYWRGYALFKLKKYDEAIAAVNHAMELKPDQVGCHWVTGAILSQQNKKAEAIAEFEKEIANPSTDQATRVNSYINIGLLQRDLGKHDASIAAFEKVIELDKTQSEAYSYLAEQYLAAGQPAKAEEVQAKGRALGVEDPKAVFNIGATYWNDKQFAKAADSFRRAVTLDPSFSQAWKSLGYALLNEGKTDEAAKALGKYVELEPGAADAAEVKKMIKEIQPH
jgi:tetratricopeptide (TPR) repeat protein